MMEWGVRDGSLEVAFRVFPLLLPVDALSTESAGDWVRSSFAQFVSSFSTVGSSPGSRVASPWVESLPLDFPEPFFPFCPFAEVTVFLLNFNMRELSPLALLEGSSDIDVEGTIVVSVKFALVNFALCPLVELPAAVLAALSLLSLALYTEHTSNDRTFLSDFVRCLSFRSALVLSEGLSKRGFSFSGV